MIFSDFGYFSTAHLLTIPERYGGIQEWEKKMTDAWKSEKRQMWCATGYLRMILFGILGMEFVENGVYIRPVKLNSLGKVKIFNLKYRNMTLNITLDKGKETFILCGDEGIKNIFI